jgi:hypothetical protein
MTWDDPAMHPARARVAHANGATGFARLGVVVPDMTSALRWLGGSVPSGVVLDVGAQTGTRSLHLSSPTGEIPVG